jgi:hypothetical protein
MGWRAKEKYVSEVKSRTGWVQNKEWAFAAAGYLPLSPSILQEFERDLDRAYHVTDIKSYPKLKSIQGRRVDIATFTKASHGIVKGLLTDGELLVTLKGKTSVMFEGDVNTELDRNGIRWLKSNGNVSKRVNEIVYEFSVDIANRVIKKFDITRDDPMGRRSKLPEEIAIHNWIYDKPGGVKKQFLNYYYAEAKKLVNKPLIDKINKALGWRDNQNISHDEILLHNFKITDTRLILSEEQDKEAKMWDRADAAGVSHFEVIEEGDVYDLGK